LARTSFSFTKRQKEMDRKKKQEEKRQRKLDKRGARTQAEADPPQPSADEEHSNLIS
jgi:hypothetical protein